MNVLNKNQDKMTNTQGVKDIEGTLLEVGDAVYYARKNGGRANGVLNRCIITLFPSNGHVQMGRMTSTNPSRQLVKVKQ